MTHPQSFDRSCHPDTDRMVAEFEAKRAPAARIVRTMVCSYCDYDAGEDPISTRRCPACHHVNTFDLVEIRR